MHNRNLVGAFLEANKRISKLRTSSVLRMRNHNRNSNNNKAASSRHLDRTKTSRNPKPAAYLELSTKIRTAQPCKSSQADEL